jgi:hypothetical protein
MAKMISQLRPHDALDYSEREREDDEKVSSTTFNAFGAVLIALCVVGAVALMLTTLSVSFRNSLRLRSDGKTSTLRSRKELRKKSWRTWEPDRGVLVDKRVSS